MFGTLVVFIILSKIHANPIHDTTEISTASKEILDNTTDTELLENRTTSTFNVTSIPIMANIETLIPNSTVRSGTIQGKLVTYNTTTYYYYTDYTTSSYSSGSGLSGGAIAGIVIGIILLICCCACAGASKGGHWENARVWVSD